MSSVSNSDLVSLWVCMNAVEGNFHIEHSSEIFNFSGVGQNYLNTKPEVFCCLNKTLFQIVGCHVTPVCY